MPTVRSPSSVAARKMRIAISLRLAARSFWIGLVAFISERSKSDVESDIVSRPRQNAAAVYSIRRKNEIHGGWGWRGGGEERGNNVWCRYVYALFLRWLI